MRYLSLLVAGLIFLAGACRKGSSGPGASPLLFVNTSVHQPSVDIFSNGSLLFPHLSFPDNTGYLQLQAPVNQLTILSAGDTLLNKTIKFKAGREYSVFVLDTFYVVDTAVKLSIQTAVAPDSFPLPKPGYALLRFLNFSPSVPNLDLYAATNGQYLFTDRVFGKTDANAVAFVPYPSGSYNLELRATGSVVSNASLNGVVLQDGKAYTFFAKGVTGVAGNRTLGIGMLQHN